MSKPEIECSRVRACKWQGNFSDLTKKPNIKESEKYDLQIEDNVCPNCGCKTFYEIGNDDDH